MSKKQKLELTWIGKEQATITNADEAAEQVQEIIAANMHTRNARLAVLLERPSSN